ncbi:ABC transporter substrate-binding protein [Actinomadura chibensis]|uniref:ABC transporter substrate-binding protein n=1 Tax=Actinomadura chibensis TaxID=392828 RepID=A0A5D0NVL1_9ACTN|nr:ABC transporter substrate-binding protein [Actinomadura chibensis]TYB48228.1 ABC transporter substrate-binding protein [Actinomadura chibensis]
MRHKPFVCAALALGFALGAAACGSGESTVGTVKSKVKIGWIGQMSDAGLIMARASGYFKGQGLDVQFVQFKSGADMVAPLATGELDFGAGAYSAGFANAVNRGRPMVMIADKNSSQPKHSTEIIEVRKDLAGKIKNVAGFAGHRIGFASSEGTSAWVYQSQLLERNGLALKDLKITYYSPSDLYLALKQGAVDVGLMSEPTATQAEKDGVAVPLMTGDDYAPLAQIAVLFTSSKLASSSKPTVQKFVNAYACGVRQYTAAMDGGTGKEGVTKTIADATGIPADIVAAARPAGFSKDLTVNARSIAFISDQLAAKGLIKKAPEVSKLIDNGFVQKATGEKLACPTA